MDGFVTVPGGDWHLDPDGDMSSTGLLYQTRIPPQLPGNRPGSFSWRYGRWLPADLRSVSRDGSHYAYTRSDFEIDVVEIASGDDRSFRVPYGMGLPTVLYYAQEGIYFTYEAQGTAPGLWLLNPRTGGIQTIFTDKVVGAVGGYAAWLNDLNPADPHPVWMGDLAPVDQILRRDLNGGPTVTWLYRPGHALAIVGFDQSKNPLIAVDHEIWSVTAANQGRKLYSGSGTISVMADSHGIWFAGDEGIWLYAQASGARRMAQVVGKLGGACGPTQPTSNRG